MPCMFITRLSKNLTWFAKVSFEWDITNRKYKILGKNELTEECLFYIYYIHMYTNFK